MKRHPFESSPRLVEFWLADGSPAAPGVSFSLEFDLSPPARPTRLPLRMSALPRRRRLSPTQRRMS
ncbi:hypothetical protein D3C72_2152640 [compost metagenome]